MQTQRRSVLKKLFASLAAITGFGFAAKANINSNNEKEVFNVVTDQDVPLFSQSTKYGGLIFIAGQGAHVAHSRSKHIQKLFSRDWRRNLSKLAPRWKRF